MKKILFILLLSFPFVAIGQKEYVIDCEIWARGKTNVYLVRAIDSSGMLVAHINFKGMGKKPNLIGRIVKHYPDGYGRRKTQFVIVKNK